MDQVPKPPLFEADLEPAAYGYQWITTSMSALLTSWGGVIRCRRVAPTASLMLWCLVSVACCGCAVFILARCHVPGDESSRRAGCRKAARPVRWAGLGNGAFWPPRPTSTQLHGAFERLATRDMSASIYILAKSSTRSNQRDRCLIYPRS